MSDGQKFLLSILLSMALIFAGVILLIETDIELWMFILIVTLAILVSFSPIFFIKGPQVTMENGVLRIKAPFVDLELSPDYIQAVEFRESFQPGLKTYGYGGIKKGFGDFTNKELGYYTFAGDTRIPAFVLVRHHTNQVLVFNHLDAAQTFSIYSQLKSGSKTDAPILTEGMRTGSSHGISRKHILIFAGLITAIAVVAVVALLASGHVSAVLEDDHLHVDAVMVNEDVYYTEITVSDVEFRDNMDYGSRRAGYAGLGYLSGSFQNSEFGRYTLAVHSDVSGCIVVHHGGKVLVFNLGSKAETEAFYTDLVSRL